MHWDKWMLRDNSRTYYECYRAEESYFKKELCIFGDGELRFSSTYIVHTEFGSSLVIIHGLPACLYNCSTIIVTYAILTTHTCNMESW